MGGRCDHGGVVGGKGAAGEIDIDAAAAGLGFEAGAEFAIGGDAAGNEDGARVVLFGGG